MPLGVCANCVAPIGVSAGKKGVHISSMLAMMVASPLLSPIGLVMFFSVFPLEAAITRVVAVIVLILALIPCIEYLFEKKEEKQNFRSMPVTSVQEPLLQSLFSALKLMGKNVIYLLAYTLPLMLLAGFLGGAMITFVPLDSLSGLLTSSTSLLILGSLALLAVSLFVPVPILLDIIIGMILWHAGMPLPLVVGMTIALGGTSIFPFMMVLRTHGWKVAV